jgi:hypothetical protein
MLFIISFICPFGVVRVRCFSGAILVMIMPVLSAVIVMVTLGLAMMNQVVLMDQFMVSMQDHVLQQSIALHANELDIPLVYDCDEISATAGLIISGDTKRIEVLYCESTNQFLYSKLQP